MKKFIIILLLFSLICILFIVLFYNGYLRFNYPSTQKYPIRGIDVSHHQKKINWSKLKKYNLNFIFVKASEGGNFKDKLFLKNWKNAEKNGFIRGAYHFFTFCKTGKDQAKNFLETVPISKNTLPPILLI